MGGGRAEPAVPEDMKLPAGATCGECRHVERCLAFGFTASPTRTTCDFSPSRFVARTEKDNGTATPSDASANPSSGNAPTDSVKPPN